MPICGIDGDLPDATQAGVKIALDLQRERAVIEGLRELADGDFSAADEDHAVHLGQRREHRQARAGVAGRGAGDFLCADHAGMGERGGHAVVFEAAAGIEPLVLQQQIPGFHAHLPGEQIGLLQDGAAFADGDDVVFRAIERQQFAESPDAGKIEPALRSGSLGAQRCSKYPRLRGIGSRDQS